MNDFFLYLICISVYLAINSVIPLFFIRKSLRKHYREWIGSGAYRARHYRKIIVRKKVFYTDEFLMDLLIAIICGLLGGGFGSKILLFNFDIPIYIKHDVWLSSAVATSLIIFIATQIDRFRIIDDELSIRKIANGDIFNEDEELAVMKRECKEYILNK